ncbi:hypothetical protein OJAV_G00137760 [Oryzias javanicus]|uniref:UBC core domain-containing protein n=1 Tax=Oryzias javanicus TaxID=123683 RepID=A0A3S2P085_ORYJA|nr:hypothetical protein OJAV_G00137760 [Oryzias javanicus]
MTEPQSALLLRRQLAELNKNPVEGFSAGLIEDSDLYRWEVLIIGPPDTLYEGGVFKAHLTFPKDYPLRPPKMKFITDIWHPNVDKNGDTQMVTHQPTWTLQKSGGKTDTQGFSSCFQGLLLKSEWHCFLHSYHVSRPVLFGGKRLASAGCSIILQ